MLRGEARLKVYEQLCAVSPLTGREVPITSGERELLERVPLGAEVDPASLGDGIERLVREGLLVSDDDEHAALRRADERIVGGAWHDYSALAHAMWAWRGVEGDFDDAAADAWRLGEVTREFTELHGPPPPHFAPHREGADALELPLVDPDEPLARLLRTRRTTREFDRAVPLRLDTLALLLRWVWGVHGYLQVTEETVALKKTSPSGGGLHPVEVYPLVLNANGVEPGLYRYRPDDHALELRERLAPRDAREVASFFLAGQRYLAEADVLFVMTARFARQFWKYRQHARAYGVLLMDVAHLSQTFYLLCAQLGLGAFVTSAINGPDIDERLGLEPFAEGALAICGCGTPPARGSGVDPEFTPYVPRETRI